jgi:hypothetical protein
MSGFTVCTRVRPLHPPAAGCPGSRVTRSHADTGCALGCAGRCVRRRDADCSGVDDGIWCPYYIYVGPLLQLKVEGEGDDASLAPNATNEL